MGRQWPSAVPSWTVFMIILGAGVTTFFASRSEHESAPNVTRPTTPIGTQSYALDTTRSSWPPLGEGSQTQSSGGSANAANYYVVLDASGSMQRSECSGNVSKIEAAVAALNTFIEGIPADAHLGLGVFDGAGLTERVPLGEKNRDSVRASLAAVRADGGTPLHSAIALGFERLTDQGRRQLGYGEYHLVLVTDGHADPKSEDPTSIVNRILMESPVLLHTIGFCIGPNHVLNQPGRAFYVAADSPEQLKQGLDSVLAEAPAFDVSRFGN